MSNLDFVANWDLEGFKRQCVEQRALALRYPAYDKGMAQVEEYHWRLGDWSLGFMLETWGDPLWHGSAAVLDVPYKTDPTLRLEVPKPQPLFIDDWDADHFAQARFLLAEMFGPIIRPGDNSQRAQEALGALAMHWYVRHDYPE